MFYGDPTNGTPLDEQAILRLVNDRRAGAEDAYRPFFSKTKEWYNIYRGIVSGRFNRNDVVIPMLFSQILSDVAQKAQALFGESDIVQFSPVTDSDAMVARKNSKLVNLQLADAQTYTKGVDFLLSAAIYGTGIARTSWKFEQHNKLFRARVLDQEFTVKQPQVTFDGPNWDVVDILDFLPEPGKRRLEDCAWVIHTYYLDFDDILEMQFDGSSMFDPEGIQKLAQSPMSAPAIDAWKLRITTYRTAQDMNNRMAQRYSKPVRIDEYWGTVPQEFAINGDRNVVITVANQKTILRYAPNPFWNSRLPFLVYTPMPDIHALHGTGKCEIGAKTQRTINRLANIKLDSLEIFAAPMFFVSNNSGLDGQQLISGPGRMFPVQGEDVGKVVMPISPDIRGLSMIFEEIQALSGFQQQGVGIDASAVQGMEGPDRETAHGFQGRRDLAMSRLAQEAELAGRMFIEPLSTIFREYDRQLLDLPKEIHFLGNDALQDPYTGMPIPTEGTQIGLNDLRPDYRCRALGATRMMGKSIQAQQLFTFMQAAGANPVMASIVNWVSFTRILANSLNLNPTDILVQQQIPLINTLAAQKGLSPADFINSLQQQPAPQIISGNPTGGPGDQQQPIGQPVTGA